jgi:hypothetical protein
MTWLIRASAPSPAILNKEYFIVSYRRAVEGLDCEGEQQ